MLTDEQKKDLDVVLNFVTFTAKPIQLEQYEEEHGISQQELHDSLQRLGQAIGLDAGVL